jgi:TonB family protein
MSETDVTPRLVSMYQGVRDRLLPVVARDLYGQGKTHFEAKNYPDATAAFQTVLALTGADQAGSPALDDLRLLAEGFLKLAERDAEAVRTPVAAPDPSSAAAPPPSSMEAPPAAVEAPVAIAEGDGTSPAIYSTEDTDVRAPIEIRRDMPPWVPSNRVLRSQVLTGSVRVVVAEDGSVESARMIDSVSPDYDQSLLQAATTWRFRPAQRLGKNVKYAMVIGVALKAAGR